ncbi:prostaglandin E synthase 2 [Anopheles bellator]|uniref:prostaglandin E synthase 2 n=1 Tax=Anopheles bellator TaxID=139047 RepID=UPI002649212A|nr:prostaglandin E synthase 2 [Anopheles bellator]
MATIRLSPIVNFAFRTTLRGISRNPNVNFVRHLATGAGKRSATGTLGLAMKGVFVGALVGTGWSGYKFFTGSGTTDHMLHEHVPAKLLEKVPDVKIFRKIVNPKDTSGLDLVLFQFQTCPFCCKVRAFLDYMGLSYSVVEVDAVLRQDIRWSDSKKVPILLAKTKDGKYVQLTDSSMIVSAITSYLQDTKHDIGDLARYYPSISYENDAGKKVFDIMNKYFVMLDGKNYEAKNKEAQEEERKWRAWADDHMVHLISPNVYRTMDEALETFNWFAEVGDWNNSFPSWERHLMVYVGAFAMWGISKRLKKRHQLSDDVRSHIYDACDRWIAEIDKRKTTFLGGKHPNLADLAVFGVLNSMEGCQAFADCLENTNIGPWFYAVKEQVLKNRGNVV